MTRATVLPDVRRMRCEELYERRQRRELTMAEAAEILGVMERTFRRWSVRYETEGAAGFEDRRLGRASARAVPVDEALQMGILYETRYTGWTVNHFHERWQADHGGPRSSTWTKQRLQAKGQVVRAPRRGAHRKKRPRKPLSGMMLYQDGSRHEWGLGCQWDLIATVDDATTELSSAFFVEEEGTMSSFQGLREGIETRGLVSSLYTDRGTHDWYTEEAGGKIDKTRPTQVHRALRQLGITLIPAYSPEARGRASGRVRMEVIPDFAGTTITEFAARNIAAGTTISTDGLPSFAVLAANGYPHVPRTQPLPLQLRQGAKSVVPLADRMIVNLQSWLVGTHHGVSRDQLQVYLDEFVFRTNRRREPRAAFQTLLGLGSSRGPTAYTQIQHARDRKILRSAETSG